MAKRKRNKAAKIREAFEQLGHDARPRDVIATLASRRIKVSSAQVSNIKSALGKSSKNGKAFNGEISLAALLDAKRLVRKLGIERARTAVDALAKLKG